jgi:DNA-binding CsgD family transcriptional regulator
MPLSLDQRTSSTREPRVSEAPASVDLGAPERATSAGNAPDGIRQAPGPNGLTPRESEVMNHLLDGASYKATASAMNLSVHTVHDHVKNIFRRLRVASRGELQARFREPNAAPPSSGSQSALRPREREVLAQLLIGAPYKVVAKEMGISVHTVHDYVKAIFREFGVSSKGELLARFRAPLR